MRKIFLILALFLFSFVKADEIIQAGIKYNEATARIEAFKNVEKKIERDFLKKYLKDENRKENLAFIEDDVFETGLGRSLCPFYLKKTLASYSVTYDNEPKYNFYYNILGSLIKFDIVEVGSYPKRTLGYSRFGNLISVAFSVDENEQFIYDEDGKLVAHWLDDVALDKNNKTPRVLKLQRGFKK